MKGASFVLSGVLIEGATAFTNLQFFPLYQSYLGKKISVNDLHQIARAITRHYHDAGYFLSYTFLPAQRIEFGIVRIRVIEGYISNWKFTGDVHGHDPLVEKILMPLVGQRPLRRVTMEAAFQRLGVLPDIIFHPYVHAVPNHLGAYELVLNTRTKHVSIGASIDNHGIEYLGPVQGMVSMQAFGLTGHHESYRFRFATTAQIDELRYFDLDTRWLLGENGAQVQASAAHTTANPEGRLKPLDAHIQTNRLRLGTSYPLQLAPHHSTYVGLAINLYRSHTDLLGLNRLENRLTTVTVNVRHVSQYDTGVTHSLGLALSQGLKIAGSRVLDTLSGTEAGRPDFFKLSLYYSYLRVIEHRVQLSLLLGGQYAATALPALERYSVGGEQFGRAYDPSEIIGDSGLAGHVEVAYRQPLRPIQWTLSPYGFYDLGAVWQSTSQSLIGSASLASCGLGVRAAGSRLSMYVEVDKPLTRRVASQGDKDPRVFGGVAYQF